MARAQVLSCGALGGRSPKTGKPVGQRHRWSGGAWGNGRCEFCFRTLSEVLFKPEQQGTPQHLARALKTGD